MRENSRTDCRPWRRSWATSVRPWASFIPGFSKINATVTCTRWLLCNLAENIPHLNCDEGKVAAGPGRRYHAHGTAGAAELPRTSNKCNYRSSDRYYAIGQMDLRCSYQFWLELPMHLFHGFQLHETLDRSIDEGEAELDKFCCFANRPG